MTECERLVSEGIISEDFLKAETLCDYEVSVLLKKIWAVELDLLREFKRVCEKHHLKWYATFGTLLGAVRHKGFIPWDDDFDVMMPREDYEKLTKEYASEFKYPYFLQTPYTDKEYCFSFAKLRNSNTSFISEGFVESEMQQGIFFDIFPMDESMEEGRKERKEKIASILKKCSAYMSRNNKYIFNKHTEVAKDMMFSPDDNIRLYDEIQNIAQNSEAGKASWYSTETITMCETERKSWPKHCFEETVELPFCNMTVLAPAGYDEILTRTYGDYMSFPPVEQRGLYHSRRFLNPDKSYEDVRKDYLCDLAQTRS